MPLCWDGMDEEKVQTVRGAMAEFIATTLFVFFGPGSALSPLASITSISLTFGFMIAILVASIGDISGGHINPAVTISLMASRNMPIGRGVIFIIAQLLGGILGAALLCAGAGNAFSDGAGVNHISPGVTDGEAFVMELMGTFLLVFVVYSTAVKPKNATAIAPYYIGLAVACAHLVLIPFTGCSINPARAFGPTLVQDNFESNATGNNDHWVMWVGPIAGSLLATVVFYLFHGEINYSGGGADNNNEDAVEMS